MHEQGESDVEIAAAKGISRSQAGVCLHQARKRLGIETSYGKSKASTPAVPATPAG